MKIKYKKKFTKRFAKLHQKIQKYTIEKIAVFQINPLEPSLNNHALTGEYLGHRSINISGDFRAIFCEYPEGTYEFVDFVDLGTHSQLYG